MYIDDARNLKVGTQVSFPRYWEVAAGAGEVIAVCSQIRRNLFGIRYVLVTIKTREGATVVWPSNRIRLT